MKIGFDAKRYFNNTTGLGNYSRTLVANLLRFYPEYQYFLYSPSVSLYDEKLKLSDAENVRVRTAGSKNQAIWRSFEIKKDIKSDNLDIYHGLSHELPRNNDNLHCKKIVTIHDLIFKTHPEFFPYIDRSIYHIKCKHSLQTSDKIIAISENTKKDIINYYQVDSQKIEVIYQACDPKYYESDADKVPALPKSFPTEYNLSVGSLEPRKNTIALIKAYQNISEKERIPLFLIGNGKRHKKLLQEKINASGLQKYIHILTQVPSELLPAMYKNAQMLIYPSFYEGFGLPVAEALLCATPVVTSHNSSLMEAGGPFSKYIDPTKPEEIAQAILTIQSDSEMAAKMREEGKKYALKTFDPKRVSDQIIQLYQKELK